MAIVFLMLFVNFSLVVKSYQKKDNVQYASHDNNSKTMFTLAHNDSKGLYVWSQYSRKGSDRT